MAYTPIDPIQLNVRNLRQGVNGKYRQDPKGKRQIDHQTTTPSLHGCQKFVKKEKFDIRRTDGRTVAKTKGEANLPLTGR